MDKITEKVVSYALAFSDSDMTPGATRATEDHLFDSIACAIAGSGSEPAAIAAKVGRLVSNDDPATVFGFDVRTSPELAALANAMMIRTFDFNDGLGGIRGGGHPSDMISGILAGGEVAHASGKEVLMAIALGYDTLAGLGYDIGLVGKGFDQGTFMGVSVATAVGKLWGLPADQLGNAISLALIANVPMSVSRWGELSMMKGCATSFAARNGVLAAQLAQEGFTSAPEPFEGIYGLHHITGPFDAFLPLNKAKRAIEMGSIKALPAEGNAQGVLSVIPKIRAWTPVEDIEDIEVEMAEHLIIHIGDEPKYDPKTRETADHSLPYMLAVALVDGKITLDSYRPERYLDQSLRPLMRKVRIVGNKAYADAMWAQTQADGISPDRPARIKVRTKDGRLFDEEVRVAPGHPTNPMTREQLNAKFDGVCDGVSTLSDEQRERIRNAWWEVGKATDIGDAMKTMTGFRQL